MANPEHVKLVLRREDWNQSRAEIPEVRPDPSGASLFEADLSRANLREAALSRADLSGANLSEADLTGTRLYETIFANVDLQDAKGLAECQFLGPCTLDHRTVERSGKLPLLFDTLQGRGIRCWLDEKQMLPGDDIYEEVDRGIRFWDRVLLCCSKHSLSSWWVDNEIDTAFEKERRLMEERGKKTLTLIPLDLDGHLLDGNWQSGKARQVLSRIVADFRGWDGKHQTFESAVERVILALRADDGARAPAPTPKL